MREEIIVVTWGGIGDLMLCTPALKALKEENPHSRIIVYYQHFHPGHKQVLLNNPHIDSLRELHVTSMWRYPRHLFVYLFKRKKWIKDRKYYHMYLNHVPATWIYEKNYKEVAADVFDVKLSGDRKIQLFFTAAEEQQARERIRHFKNVVFIHTYSKCSVNHLWDIKKWNRLVKELPELTFIQIGMPNEPTVEGAIDWRSKLSLRETLCQLKYATSFVGVESSFAHATNAFNLPGVVLFGDTSPQHWGHENNVNIYKGVACSPCFHYLWGRSCPLGNDCMKLIEVEEVKEALIRQVSISSAGFRQEAPAAELIGKLHL
ncbi:glycosyltransferase family 9 protein [Chitinophaga sp. ARDCPP14]|uniref:glycosyltransferase family 9 protein n=1 Tax=Chitinophaga sp. ARDCPP14 TaxID=3391139 RepID=UPI003F528FE6